MESIEQKRGRVNPNQAALVKVETAAPEALPEISNAAEEQAISLHALPLDQNPAAVYLATLRPVGRRGMQRALDLVAELLSNGRYNALTFPWNQLRFQHTAAVAPALVEKGYRAATINQALSGLRQVLYYAWKLGQMDGEDYRRARDIKNVRSQTLPRGRALVSEEMAALMRICQADRSPAGVRDAALIALLYTTGLRRSEVVALTLKDYNRRSGALTVRGGKGGKDRLVYLSEGEDQEESGVEAAFAAWLALRGAEAGALFCSINKAGKLAPGLPHMTDQSILKLLLKRAKQAGLEKFSPHDLRRTFISDLLDAGADIATVQKMAGHASVVTTARYDRRGETAKKRAANLLKVPYNKS
ncbi:MAG TPA: tyrosine-type recombinase/integrase [Chloroflexia bacterium]|nr:tyrosine-type recombinase/integrase [Chloroflexia bacterium]